MVLDSFTLHIDTVLISLHWEYIVASAFHSAGHSLYATPIDLLSQWTTGSRGYTVIDMIMIPSMA